MKPVCVICQTFLKPAKIGVRLLEQMPTENGVKPGRSEPGKWRPYKLWQADLYVCSSCGTSIVWGRGLEPVMERHHPNFEEELKKNPPHFIVNDC